jgi:hypothetical protein
MADCVLMEPESSRCGGRGTACISNSSAVRCFCHKDYTGFGDFNPEFNNCDVYLPVIYFLGALVLLTDIMILTIVAWAIRERTLKVFFKLLRARNAPALLTVSAFIVAVSQVVWMSIRLSALESRAIGMDTTITVSFGISILFIYASSPHVLRHYAKLTFSDTRLMMLNVIGREKAKMRARLVRPLVVAFLPACAIVAGFGPCVSLNDVTQVKTGLQIMGVATAVFLSLTLVLIRLLVSPMVRDMKFAVSVKRMSTLEQDSLVVATRKLIFFQYLIVSTSVLYIPVMLLWAFLPPLYGSVTYMYFLGAWFCGCICGFSVYTLTNVSRKTPSNLTSSVSNNPYKAIAEAGAIVELSSATPIKMDVTANPSKPMVELGGVVEVPSAARENMDI